MIIYFNKTTYKEFYKEIAQFLIDADCQIKKEFKVVQF